MTRWDVVSRHILSRSDVFRETSNQSPIDKQLNNITSLKAPSIREIMTESFFYDIFYGSLRTSPKKCCQLTHSSPHFMLRLSANLKPHVQTSRQITNFFTSHSAFFFIFHIRLKHVSGNVTKYWQKSLKTRAKVETVWLQYFFAVCQTIKYL